MADVIQTEEKKAGRRVETGIVVSDKMSKTIVVKVSRIKQHPLYKKFIKRDRKLYAHDEKNDARVGDTVEVAEVTRPLSRLKRYELVRVVERAK